MLVMRNFGYLGLHTVVDSKSSLARDRLVDFTGELQLRRRTSDDDDDDELGREQESYRLELPKWHPNFIAEPTVNGGRNPLDSSTISDTKPANASKLYAQELAPLPLMLAPNRLSGNSQPGLPRNRPQQDDIEPFYHTSFCNELLFHPRILHNCPRGTASIKVELREVEWSESANAYYAHVPGPRVGPSIHNSRRGPFLVQSAFTSCTPRSSDHQFLDEFKLKLPLQLNQVDEEGKTRNLCLFFTVYRVKRGSKSMWKRGAKMIFGASTSGEPSNSIDEQQQLGRVEQVACGFLPITAQSCLIDNGLHDVRVAYTATAPNQDVDAQRVLPSSSLVLIERATTGDGAHYLGPDDSYAEDTTISGESLKSDRNKAATNERTDSDSQSFNEDTQSKGGKSQASKEPISLSVCSRREVNPISVLSAY